MERKREEVNSLLDSLHEKPLICACLLANSLEKVSHDITECESIGADLIELRADHLGSSARTGIKNALAESTLPILVTNRSVENGGIFPSDKEEERISILKDAVDYGAHLIDVELKINQNIRDDLIHYAHNKGTGVIVSYHNFQSTPDLDAQMGFYKEIQTCNPDLAKLVFTPKSHDDIQMILSVAVRLRRENLPYSTFGMGTLGIITRIFSALIGSSIIYTSVADGEASQLGQMSLENTKKMFTHLESGKGWKNVRENPVEMASYFSRFLELEPGITDDLETLLVGQPSSKK